ncbi:MAG: hypothetical protein ACMUEM_07370 [Flavobacteriales bacterium AspAUS03]
MHDFGVTLHNFFQYVNIVIGTEKELLVLYLKNAAHLEITNQKISVDKITKDVKFYIQKIFEHKIKILILKKETKETAHYLHEEKRQDVPVFHLENKEVVNALNC